MSESAALLGAEMHIVQQSKYRKRRQRFVEPTVIPVRRLFVADQQSILYPRMAPYRRAL
jgi:hypothetical protein